MSRYRLVDDDSGHDYVIPVERSKDWVAFLLSTNWEDGITPEWAERVDGRLTFTDPECA